MLLPPLSQARAKATGPQNASRCSPNAVQSSPRRSTRPSADICGRRVVLTEPQRRKCQVFEIHACRTRRLTEPRSTPPSTWLLRALKLRERNSLRTFKAVWAGVEYVSHHLSYSSRGSHHRNRKPREWLVVRSVIGRRPGIRVK